MWVTKYKPIPIITDYEGIWALGFVLKTLPSTQLNLVHHNNWYELMQRYGVSYPPLIVTHSQTSLENILSKLKLSTANYQEVTSTGFFKIYGTSDTALQRL
jgi:hypothetical protein